MSKMTLLALTPIIASALFAQAKPGAERQPKSSPTVQRGRYIVEDVAKCELCHTRRDENGAPDEGNWLAGGPVQLHPAYPAPHWAVETPRIAGGPPGTEEDFIKLMTTGIARTGKPPNPPMQQFHMTREDAEAVYAYLKSLAP